MLSKASFWRYIYHSHTCYSIKYAIKSLVLEVYFYWLSEQFSTVSKNAFSKIVKIKIHYYPSFAKFTRCIPLRVPLNLLLYWTIYTHLCVTDCSAIMYSVLILLSMECYTVIYEAMSINSSCFQFTESIIYGIYIWLRVFDQSKSISRLMQLALPNRILYIMWNNIAIICKQVMWIP